MDFISDNLPPLPTEVRDKYEILDCEQAFHEDGRQMWYGLEGCKLGNVVVVSDDNGKSWVRGKFRMKYRVMMTGTNQLGPFPAGEIKRIVK